jgi:hypothetical protein
MGLIFGIAMLPLLDGFTSLVLSFFEMIKSYFALKIANNNQKIQELSADPPKHIIGFDLRGEVEENDI